MFATKRGRLAARRVRAKFLGIEEPTSQRLIIASTLAMCGLPSQAKEYLCIPTPRQYWVEADVLGAHAISMNDRDVVEKTIKALIILTKIEFTAPRSIAIINYNIARLYQFMGDYEAASSMLDSAKAISRKAVDERLKVDAVFEASQKA